jgi:hypothetical protein
MGVRSGRSRLKEEGQFYRKQEIQRVVDEVPKEILAVSS